MPPLTRARALVVHDRRSYCVLASPPLRLVFEAGDYCNMYIVPDFSHVYGGLERERQHTRERQAQPRARARCPRSLRRACAHLAAARSGTPLARWACQRSHAALQLLGRTSACAADVVLLLRCRALMSHALLRVWLERTHWHVHA